MVNNRILFLGWYKTLNHSMARTPFFYIWVYVNKFLYITHQSNLCENHIEQVRFLETSATTELCIQFTVYRGFLQQSTSTTSMDRLDGELCHGSRLHYDATLHFTAHTL